MDLLKLFEAQAILDNKIVEEKGLQDDYLLNKKILALLVELGELANELPEKFKFWANKNNNHKKALEEYVDCLHFILSIGNSLGCRSVKSNQLARLPNATDQFNLVFYSVSYLYDFKGETAYKRAFMTFLGLGDLLGFTQKEVEEAYYKKNEINHERQANGY